MTGIIYCIKNILNGKCYIGQSLRPFHCRYPQGKWYVHTHNILLKREAEQYGYNNFEVTILHEKIQCIHLLNSMEKEAAIKYNCYYPAGYNFTECGNNKSMHSITKEKIREAHVRKRLSTVRLKEVKTGKIIEILNLTQFCKDNDLNRGNLLKMIYDHKPSGSHLESQGYCLPDTTLEQLKSIRANKYVHQDYKFIHSDGRIIICTVKEFCDKYQINRKYISSLIRGKVKTVNGWYLKEENNPNKHFKYMNFSLQYNGEPRYIEVLNLDFCKLNQLDFSTMIKVVNGKVKSHKGYKLLLVS